VDDFCINIRRSFNISDDIKKVRFDPVSNFCVVKNLRFHSNKGMLSYSTNGYKIDSDELFLTIDPQVLILDSMEGVTWISVDAQVYEVGSDVFMECAWVFSNEYSRLWSELEAAYKKIDYYKDSVFWHMTKPLRIICNFINRFIKKC
jgi:hypothetical protein